MSKIPASAPSEGQLADVIHINTEKIPEWIVNRLCAATLTLARQVQQQKERS